MAAATVRAQAKINLFLHVTGREASGYHTLETLFCRIDLADAVSVRLTPASRSLDCTGPELPPRGLGTVAENLAWRAAVAYSDAARWPAGFEIVVEKHIPVSAGLGGGSADAGGVLRVLNALNPRPLPSNALERIARALGADVPFLTQDQATLAFGRGRGDEWQAQPTLASRACILAIPSLAVATRDAYTWIDQARGWLGREIPATRAHEAQVGTWDDVRQRAHNDFEAVVFPRFPEIAEAWAYVGDLGRATDAAAFARLTGSGGAIYAITAQPPSPSPRAAPPNVRTLVTRSATRVERVQPID